MRLILASASPRRAELLAAAGLTFETLPVDLDERSIDGEAPGVYVRRLAREKAAAARERLIGEAQHPLRDVVILGADTTVVIDGMILGKPQDDHDARRMLTRLAGRAHEVLTGISLLHADSTELGNVQQTIVQFGPLGDADVDWYVLSGEGRDKAGGYAIQGLASRFIQRIDGSYSNVVGLPVAAVYDLMREMARRKGITT